MIGSAVHVWSVAHICDLALEVNHLGPLAFVMTWTLWHRLPDFVPSLALRWQQAMLLLTAGMPVLAYSQPRLFLSLTALNLMAYVSLSVKASAETRAMAKHLALASLSLMVAGIPEEWGTLLLSGFRREHGLVMAWTVYLVLLALRSSRPQAGLIGAIAMGIVVGWLAREAGAHIRLQAGFVFLLLHSLRWTDSEHTGAILLRWSAAIGWVIHAVTWTHGGAWLEAGITGGGAIVVAAAWVACGRFAVRRVLGSFQVQWRSRFFQHQATGSFGRDRTDCSRWLAAASFSPVASSSRGRGTAGSIGLTRALGTDCERIMGSYE